MIITRNTTREAFIPSGALKVACKASGAVVYLYERAGRPVAMMFAPKAIRPTQHYRYATLQRREEAVKQFFAGQRARKETTEKRRAERSAPHSLEVGHILVASWGYEQTNLTWCQVVRVIGKNTVAIRKIAGMHFSRDTDMSGKQVPAIDHFKGDEKICRVSSGNVIRLSSCEYAHLWDGRPHFYSTWG